MFSQALLSAWVGILENDRACRLEADGLAQRLRFKIGVGGCFLEELGKIYFFSLCGRKPRLEA